MKKISTKIWWYLILAYLALGYVLPQLLRLRFMLIIFGIVAILILMKEEFKVWLYALISAAVLSLFFLKIVPSPYRHFVALGWPASLGIVLTLLTIVAALVISLLIVNYVERIITKFLTTRKK